MRQAMEIGGLLERRVDQHEAAAFRRRHIGRQRSPAVDFKRFDADIAAQILPERGEGLRLDLAGDQASCGRSQARASAGEPGYVLSWPRSLSAPTTSRKAKAARPPAPPAARP